MTINLELINQQMLAEEIASLEKGYVETVVNLVKGPIFIETVSKEILSAEGERKEALENVLKNHEANQKANEEAIEQLNQIIVDVKKFIK